MDYSLVVGICDHPRRGLRRFLPFKCNVQDRDLENDRQQSRRVSGVNKYRKHKNKQNEYTIITKHDGCAMTCNVGLIDYLQVWNLKKRVANVIKCCEYNKSTEEPSFYARRFLRHMRQLFKQRD
mmetsp:Transcript_24325/g.58709  ORF Transcript_24325/g.58709 Transcript_24325/m.58709 type:complete len:124 (-) Transcript_24325:124-495(-)